MITLGLGNNALVTKGYVKKGLLVVFLKKQVSNYKIKQNEFINEYRSVKYKVLDRSVYFIENFRAISFELTNRLANYVLLTRLVLYSFNPKASNKMKTDLRNTGYEQSIGRSTNQSVIKTLITNEKFNQNRAKTMTQNAKNTTMNGNHT